MNFMPKIFITILIFLSSISFSYSQNIEVFKFTDEELSNLKVRKVRGAKNMTKYSILAKDGSNILKAEVVNGGSGLGKEAPIDLNQTPFLNITWKVEKGLPGIDEKSKKGHDFAARFFVVKKTGMTPLSNKAINYVFSSNSSIGEKLLLIVVFFFSNKIGKIEKISFFIFLMSSFLKKAPTSKFSCTVNSAKTFFV